MNLIIDLLDAMSNRRFSGRLIYAFIIILSFYLFFMTTSLVQFTRSIRIYIPSSLNESILLYRAYYDNRTGPGIFRILAVSPCLQSSTHLSIGSDSFHSLLLHSPMEKFCPWKWAPSCKWNAYHFQSQSMPFSPQINVNLYERSVKMDVNSVPLLYETLEVCVPPLYWYDDWPRLILFVEYWKEEGASVSIYVNSVSENVKKVIDYYETEGSIKVINWSMLPRLKDEDPNKSVYRLSHSLAHNDCVLRSSSKFTTLLDLDEFIYVRNASLLEFVRSKFSEDSSVGSLLFQHRGLESESQLNESFDALDSLEIIDVDGPSKVLFNPSSVLFLSTHFVNTHVDGFDGRTISTDEAFLLHNRISFGDKERGDKMKIDEKLFGLLKEKVIETRDIVFGLNTPIFTLNVTNEVVRCTSSWRVDGCKTPIYSCYSHLMTIEKWIFMHSSSDSHFNIL